MLFFYFLKIIKADVSYDQFEYMTQDQLRQALNGTHEFISTNLANALTYNLDDESRKSLQILLDKHNSFIIDDIFNAQSDQNKMYLLEEHFGFAIDTVDKVLAVEESKNKNVSNSLKQVKESIGYETKAAKSFRERPTS